jgi:hypothetical protein
MKIGSYATYLSFRLLFWVEELDWFRGLATKRQRWEMQDWTRKLTAMNVNEIGMVVAVGTHIRHQLEARWCTDLLDPVAALHANPRRLIEISVLIKEFQTQSRWTNAAGAMIWLFTLRAAVRRELRADGRALWRELARGFITANEAKERVKSLSGESLNIEGASRYPLGLEPDLQNHSAQAGGLR